MPKISNQSTLEISPHLMVWSAMSARAVSELYSLPPKCTGNTKYYIEHILTGNISEIFGPAGTNTEDLTKIK